MIAVVLGIALAWLGIRIDHHLDQTNSDIPLSFASTVESARAVLRSVRSPPEKGGDPNIPNLSVAIAVALGIGTILAIVAFIDHSAHSMDISNILHNIEQRATEQIEREWRKVDSDATQPDRPVRPLQHGHTIRFDQSGWVQLLDVDKLTDCLDPGMSMWVDTYPGRYAVRGTPICVLSAIPDDVEAAERKVRAALSTGETRTMQQDVTFGLRQLTDVALKALSPGINDPTTAQDAIFHTASVLEALLQRDPPAHMSGNERVTMVQQPTHDDLIKLAFDEVRQAASSLPAVCVYLLESLALLAEACPASTPARREALLRQASLVVAGCVAGDNLRADIEEVEEAYAKRFGHVDQ